ncbi:MAG: TonB-dependent receptor [Sphingobium sp.]|nr:TonB-dependent receptor [Sphingobium sp.]MCI1271706.1 TonB-dependent receptor [Sphingobium sp.]MCI2053570.1 TonB-dependent receptor [Sphingobium sp.]
MLLAANISLPALIMGGQLGVERGFAGAAIACFWGGLVLAALAGVCAYVGARSRLTTYVLIMRAFGERGGAWINFLLSWSAIGWFGVVLMLFADTMVRMTAGTIPIWAVGGLLLMAYTTIIGFRALQWLSNVMLPAKFGLLIWAIWAAVRIHGSDFLTPIPERATLDARTAISFVVGGWVVGAVVAPDFARYARNAGRAGFACAFALGVGYPLVLLAAAVPAILTGERDMLTTMANLGMGTAALAIVLFASWTNGANNLYSGSLMLATVFRQRRRASLIWAAGGLGTIIGLAGGSLEGFVNLPLNDRMALRLVGFYQHDGGYIDNTLYNGAPSFRYTVTDVNGNLTTFTPSNAKFAKKNFNQTDTYGGRAALGIDLDENWTAMPQLIYQHQKAEGSFLFDPRMPGMQVHDFTDSHNRDEWVQAALTIRGKIGNFDLTYAGGYFDRTVDNVSDYSYYTVAYYAKYAADVNYGPVLAAEYFTSFINASGNNIDPSQFVHGNDKYTKQSHELRISSPSGDRFRFTAGLFYQRQTDKIVADYYIPGLAAIPGSPAVRTCGDDIFCTRGRRVDKDYAAFADASFDITPSITLSAGIRGFKAKNHIRGFSGFSSQATDPTNSKYCISNVGDPNIPCINYDRKTKEDGEVHRVNLSWKVDKDRMLYATYSTGYRPGGNNRTPGINPYKADTLTNFEIGAKTAWFDRTLFLNVAAYTAKWKDVQYGLPGQGGVVSTYNAGNARIKGVEGDISWRMGGFTVSGSASYVDAKLTSDFCQRDASQNPDCTLGITVPAGTRLPTQPHFKSGLTARYAFDVGSNKAFVQGGMNYQSGTRVYLETPVPYDPTLSVIDKTRGFATFDFSAGIDFDRWRAEAFIQNAFDKRGILSYNSACVPGICGAYARAYPIKPQLFGMKLGTKF